MNLKLAGVLLRRLAKDDLEMLRSWRNDKKIARVMFYQQYISEQMQVDWFNGLGPSDYYFIIETNQHPVGMIHLNVERDNPTSAHAGLFIYDESYWGTQVPVFASLILLHFAFEHLGLQEVRAKVKKENEAAKTYNRSLGFKQLEEEIQYMNKADYDAHPKIMYQRAQKWDKKEKPSQ